jgi:hypothetical protein
LRLHVLDVLEAVAQVADEGMVHVLEHSPFAYDVADAFRAYDFIFPDVFESERQACVFPLDDTDFAKGTSTDDSQETEVVQVHLAVEFDGFSLAVSHGLRLLDFLSSNKLKQQYYFPLFF